MARSSVSPNILVDSPLQRIVDACAQPGRPLLSQPFAAQYENGIRSGAVLSALSYHPWGAWSLMWR